MNVRALAAASLICALLAGCAVPPKKPAHTAEEVQEQVSRLLPARAERREAWASSIADAFIALEIDPTNSHLCAALAVAEQESGFAVDPPVAGLGTIARSEIDRRAQAHHIPKFMVDAALAIHSANGKTYGERIAAVHTERELSLVYEDLIDRVPLGQRLFAESNPVRTGGPLQVSIAYAEQQVHDRPYPYPLPPGGTIRHEVFTLRGGVYFGIAHLLAYPVSYDRMIYRFADFNAGHYASRNAAFQNAVAIAAGTTLALDGDLIDYSGDVGKTERALRSIERELDLSDSAIRRALESGERLDFEQTDLYRRVYALAEKQHRAPLPRAMIPHIDLASPKITRKLTTQWYADRVEQRYRSCLARAGSGG
ncbi:MAG TPA: DUF1615 domain-containing protein [Rudaea sp.]